MDGDVLQHERQLARGTLSSVVNEAAGAVRQEEAADIGVAAARRAVQRGRCLVVRLEDRDAIGEQLPHEALPHHGERVTAADRRGRQVKRTRWWWRTSWRWRSRRTSRDWAWVEADDSAERRIPSLPPDRVLSPSACIGHLLPIGRRLAQQRARARRAVRQD
eukprot:1823247-Prymnesium_polylepis.1